MANYLSYDTYHNAEVGMEAIQNIPLEIGRWQGEDIPLENLIYEILETTSIIQRTYRTLNGQDVLLSIVYYPETKVDFHAPEACLAGQGVEIQKLPKSINILYGGREITLNVNQLIWKHDTVEKLVFYCYKAGSFLGRSYIKLRFNLAANKFTNAGKSGSLIRVSTRIQDSDIEKASEILNDFLTQLYPYLVRSL
jgi:EpsI family protein